MPGCLALLVHPGRGYRGALGHAYCLAMATHGQPATVRGPAAGQPNPFAIMRSAAYLKLLALAVLLGVPIAAAAGGFLKLTNLIQGWTFTDLPHAIGFSTVPNWWPLAPLAVAGLVVGLTVRYLPGGGGESPANGFSSGKGPPAPSRLPGILLAALASVGLGAVIGPEAPLIALGAGLAYLAVRLTKRDLPAQAIAMVAATGSFAAISTLLGTPLAGAFLLLEITGIGGAMATAVLLPGLLGAGVGALIFTGLDSLTGFGTFTLAVPNLPQAGAPTGAEFGWAIAVGVVAGPLVAGLRWLALMVRDRLDVPTVPVTLLLGLAVAALAIAYGEVTGHQTADVLFSGQSALRALLTKSDTYTVGALLMLLLFKGLAYSFSLARFRGGPTFPAMFLGAAGGVALSHLPGLPLVPAAAMGIGAMTAAMLRLPMSAVLLTTLFLGSDGFAVIPLTIVAAVIAYVTAIWLSKPQPAAGAVKPPTRHEAEPVGASPLHSTQPEQSAHPDRSAPPSEGRDTASKASHGD